MPRVHEYTYQIKVSLNGVRPPVWRRLLIPSSMDLAELHSIIQVAMGWTNSHLHEFVVGRARYGEPDPDFADDTTSEYGVRVDSVLRKEKQSIVYTYDFGDGWEHKVTLEKILPYSEDAPKCIVGRRSCPPEDVGGIYGYAEFLQAYSDKTHPEHREMVEWAGANFDPERFDIGGVNAILTAGGGRA